MVALPSVATYSPATQSVQAVQDVALSDAEYDALLSAHPDPADKVIFDVDTFPQALVAAASHDPVLTVDDAERLRGMVHKYEWQTLFEAAFGVQNEKPRPFTGTGTAPAPIGAASSATA